MADMGASQATGLGSSKEPEPHSGLGPTGAIPCAVCGKPEWRHNAGVRSCGFYPTYQPLWRAVDTAPRDGSEFQGWVRGWVTPAHPNGFWEPRCRFNPDTEAFEMWGRVDYDEDGWDIYPDCQLAYWMPHPCPPASVDTHPKGQDQ